MSLNQMAIGELTERSREILRTVVEAYVETGEPVGSRTISRKLGLTLSPATIRNVMADLEESGLLYAPHTSAGRLPTELGLRLFVHGLLEIGSLTHEERASIDGQCRAAGKSLAEVLEQATEMLSGLSHCAGLVVAPKVERPLKHIEFVQIGPGRALVVLVAEGGLVENRIVDLPAAMPPSSLVEAGNYLTQRLVGRTLSEARAQILNELEASRAELDQLTAREREVLRYIARGYAYKEVAHELHISVKTVETHVSAVLRKLQLSSRYELTRWAADRRLV